MHDCISRWKASGGETEHDLRVARREQRGVQCFLDTFSRAHVEESCVLWGHGKCFLRTAVPSTSLLIPPGSLQEKGTRVCVLATRWLPALALSCPPPHPRSPGLPEQAPAPEFLSCLNTGELSALSKGNQSQRQVSGLTGPCGDEWGQGSLARGWGVKLRAGRTLTLARRKIKNREGER